MQHKFALAVMAIILGNCLLVQEPKAAPPEDPVHEELRALRDGVLDAFNKSDLERLLTFVHKDAVLTWQNAEVSRGHQGIRDYYQKMMTGPNKVVESVKGTATVDDLTTLYGDKNGVAVGALEQDFKLADGTDLHLSNRWTADVVKEDGKWRISRFHVSANLFDNPVQQIAIKKTAQWTGGIAGLAGLLIGVLGTVIVGRLRQRS